MEIIIILLIILIAEVSYLVLRAGNGFSVRMKHPVFIDTSALMDGRIVTAAQTGFMPKNIVIPKSVVAELQYLADQADAEKRSRARRGLDAISQLQEASDVSVQVLDDGPVSAGGVDERLVQLARKHSGSICTIDFNLNKVATVQGIRVLNINELAGSIRMAFLPGETISMPLSQKGQGNGQAIGYLADGTMVVVDKAAGRIGQTVEIEFIRSLQTAAGRMMFAKMIGKHEPSRNDSVAPSKTPRSTTKKADGESESAKPVAQAKVPRQPRADRSSDKKQSQPARRTNNRRRTKEDSLIELVNKQD